MGEAQSSFKNLALRHFFLSKSLRFGQNKLFFFIYIQSPIRSGQTIFKFLHLSPYVLGRTNTCSIKLLYYCLSRYINRM